MLRSLSSKFSSETKEWFVRDDAGGEETLYQRTTKKPADSVEKWPYYREDDEAVDLVQMQYAEGPNVLSLLKRRFLAGQPYTRIGMRGVLISVNPYRKLDIYGAE